MGARITPWKDQAEWLHVKSCFYPNEPSSVEEVRLRSISRVNAWSVRGRVPHAVVSTSMLTTALLRDQASVLTYLESRMMLAMALTRFVNGLLDPAQQAAYAISMSALAKTIALPESFVEIRHSATHDSLPSLPILRTALVQALDWLWHNYWNVSPKNMKSRHNASENEANIHSKVHDLLKRWRKVRRTEPERPIKTGDPELITKESLQILKDLVSMKDNLQTIQALAEGLICPKNLLSSRPKTAQLWSPLLETVCKAIPDLRGHLVLHGIQVLGEDAKASDIEIDLSLIGEESLVGMQANIPNVDGSYERLQSWLLWLLRNDPDTRLDYLSVFKALSLERDVYTLEVMEKLKDTKGFEELERFILLRKGAVPNVHNSTGNEAVSLPITEVERTSPVSDQNSVSLVARSGKWQKIRQSQAQPIGFLVT